MRTFRNVLFALAAALVTAPTLAAEIVIADVAPFTGPVAPHAESNYIGAKAYFDSVNAHGGVNGNTIRLVRGDTKYDPKEAVNAVVSVAQHERPLAFINLLGSSSVSELRKEGTFDKLGIPVIGINPGSETLRNPMSRYMFNVTAGDNAQLAKVLEHLSTIGLQRIATACQAIPYGTSGCAFVEASSKQYGLKIVGTAAMAAGATDAKAAAKTLASTGAQAYVMVLTPGSDAAFVRDVRAAGDATPIYGLSYATPQALVAKAGLASATGVALAQVTPNPSSPTTRLVREYQEAIVKYATPGTPYTSQSLDGFIAAKVIVEGLRRIVGEPTPAKLMVAVGGIRDLEFGGYRVDFAPGTNVGSKQVTISMVDGNGRLLY